MVSAYAARAGVRARIFVPEAASGPKRRQIEAYGAEVVSVPGPRGHASDAVLRAVAGGAVYASHAWLPYHPAGYATIACELAAAPGGPPATVIAPAGQGGLILGLALGFEALVRSGVLRAGPKLIAVQAARCAPLARAWTMGIDAMAGALDEPTAAEGVRVPRPARAAEVLGAIRGSGGEVVAVEEERILPARECLAGMGFFVEPTCALVLDAFLQHGTGWPGPVTAILTGSGLKSP